MTKEILYENPKIEIVNDDCLNYLKELLDNSIDCIITDPPYKISVKGNKIIRTYANYNWKRRGDVGLDFGEWDRRWKSDRDYFLWTEKWFNECVRVLKMVVGCIFFLTNRKLDCLICGLLLNME